MLHAGIFVTQLLAARSVAVVYLELSAVSCQQQEVMHCSCRRCRRRAFVVVVVAAAFAVAVAAAVSVAVTAAVAVAAAIAIVALVALTDVTMVCLVLQGLF